MGINLAASNCLFKKMRRMFCCLLCLFWSLESIGKFGNLFNRSITPSPLDSSTGSKKENDRKVIFGADVPLNFKNGHALIVGRSKSYFGVGRPGVYDSICLFSNENFSNGTMTLNSPDYLVTLGKTVQLSLSQQNAFLGYFNQFDLPWAEEYFKAPLPAETIVLDKVDKKSLWPRGICLPMPVEGKMVVRNYSMGELANILGSGLNVYE